MPARWSQPIRLRNWRTRSSSSASRCARPRAWRARHRAPKKPKPKAEKDADTRALEKLVSEAIGLKVEITHKGNAGGTMLISYKTLDQLEDVCRRLQS